MLPRLRVSEPSGDSRSHAQSFPPGSPPQPRRRRWRRRLRPAVAEPLVVHNLAPKMAEQAGPSLGGGSSTSQRDLRKSLASVAQEITERRYKHGVNFSAAPKKITTYTHANKEKQLLEKERRAKLQYEKYLEEKQQKIKEQKEKDEQRRISVEEKRKQKLADDKEKFKAIVSRTMERCNRVDQRQRRWSWEDSMVKPESKSGKTESRRSSSLNRRKNKAHSSLDPDQMGNTSGVPRHVFRYVSVPMFTDDELKAAMMLHKTTVKRLVTAKLEITEPKTVETPLKKDVAVQTNVNMNVPPKVDVKVLSPANVQVPSEGNIEDTPEVNVQVFPKVNIEVPTEVNIKGYSMSPSNKLSPVASMDLSPSTNVGSSSLMSVNISPIVSMDTSPDTSIDGSLDSIKESKIMEELPVRNIETSLASITEASSEPSDKTPDVNGDTTLQNSKMGKHTSTLMAKKKLQSNISCYRWLSSTSTGWHPPPMKTITEREKSQPLSALPGTSKLSSQISVPYKRKTIQDVLYVPNVEDVAKKMKQILSKVKENQTLSPTHMTGRESDKKFMPKATKFSLARPHPPHEQRDKEEKKDCQKEKKPSNEEAVTEKPIEGRTKEFPTCKHELLGQDLTTTSGCVKPEELEQQEVEEIMKKTRKTVVNASKSTETSAKDISKEDGSESEEKTESDEDSSSDIFISDIKTLSTKLKTSTKAVRKPQELVFLQAKTGEVDLGKKIYFNGNVKVHRQKDPKAKDSRKSTKKKYTRTMRNRKTKGDSNTVQYTKSDSAVQWLSSSRISDSDQDIRPPAAINTPNNSSKHEVKSIVTSLQGPEAPSDQKKQSNPTAPLSKTCPQRCSIPKPSDINALTASRSDFGRQEEGDQN
uniref:MAP7 domain-containing protein 3 isoform X2 n=1 Tax=Jaculus jaculus TaxID=51337 RepID=UPI001E1B2E84|nr:MAP7 domain-containing protein 3 isoform X2 [Jaculus jaculus]